VTGAVALHQQAPAQGITLELSDGNPALVSVPQDVTVPGGTNHMEFQITTLLTWRWLLEGGQDKASLQKLDSVLFDHWIRENVVRDGFNVFLCLLARRGFQRNVEVLPLPDVHDRAIA
jgi:hypothetical protein